MKQTKVREKWERTGLLSTLNEENKEKLAVLLEETAQYLLNNQTLLESNDRLIVGGFFAGSVLPLMVRIFIDKPFSMPTPKWLCEDFSEYVKKNLEFKKDEDFESKLCENYTQDFMKRDRMKVLANIREQINKKD